MTAAEAELMREHVAYWKDLAKRGIAVVFGPVADPNGAWSLSVALKRGHVGGLTANDPTIKSGLNFKFETYSMPIAVLRG